MTSSHIDFNTILLVTNNGMGKADITLQHKLIKTYLQLLLENDKLPAGICFYTEGVRLAVKGSPVLEEIVSLQHKGVHLILCRTCLEYLDLLDDVQVGVVGGMTDILEAQLRAGKVITL